MKFIFSAFIALCFLLVTSSCKKDKDEQCKDEQIDLTSLEDQYDCVNTKYQMEIDLSDDYTIIRSDSSFEEQVTGDCDPDIDFSVYDLIIGKKALSSGNFTIDYKMIEDCQTGQLTLHVTFYQNSTTEAPNLTYHALVPKLESSQSVQVEIDIKPFVFHPAN